jgi:hypothetical protein
VGQEPAAVVLIATTAEGRRLAFKIDTPATTEDLRRLAAIQSMPGLASATWTGQEGDSLR